MTTVVQPINAPHLKSMPLIGTFRTSGRHESMKPNPFEKHKADVEEFIPHRRTQCYVPVGVQGPFVMGRELSKLGST